MRRETQKQNFEYRPFIAGRIAKAYSGARIIILQFGVRDLSFKRFQEYPDFVGVKLNPFC